jgi:nicotinamide riboside kinase
MLKIVLTGPESCGKTTLARQLAAHFQVPLVEEFVREFFEKKETPQYQEADLKEIAMGQVEAENKAIQALYQQMGTSKSLKTPLLVLCDTDVLTIKIWAEEKYKRCDDWIIQQISNSKFQISDAHLQKSKVIARYEAIKPPTIYLLCSPEGIAWEADPLRENPNDSERLFEIYEQNLNFYKKNYFILRGGISERFDIAKDLIEQKMSL